MKAGDFLCQVPILRGDAVHVVVVHCQRVAFVEFIENLCIL
jgi:hypothetical protein